MSTQEQSLSTENRSSFLTAGLALFSMFFGAGNLIFPILIGKFAGHNVWFAICGLGLTGIILPFIGLIAMVLFQADMQRFFRCIGKTPGIVLLLILQLILGPFGVIPRLFTLMHATTEPYLGIPLIYFSFLFAILVFLCSFNRQKLVRFLGIYFTPLLLISLIMLVFFGIASRSATNPLPSPSASNCFLQGLMGGYNMMDLIAALPFATVVLPHFQIDRSAKNSTQGQKHILKKMLFSSLIAAVLLFLTYTGLTIISARHSWMLDSSQQPEQMLGAIAIKLLGPIGGCIAAVAILMACLTTTITLTSIFSDYLRKEICNEKIHSSTALIITLIITTLFANLGFGGIAKFLGPIVQILYPGLILLTFSNLFHSLFGYRTTKYPIFLAFVVSCVFYFLTSSSS